MFKKNLDCGMNAPKGDCTCKQCLKKSLSRKLKEAEQRPNQKAVVTGARGKTQTSKSWARQQNKTVNKTNEWTSKPVKLAGEVAWQECRSCDYLFILLIDKNDENRFRQPSSIFTPGSYKRQRHSPFYQLDRLLTTPKFPSLTSYLQSFSSKLSVN